MKKEIKILVLTGVIYLLTEALTFSLRRIDFSLSAIVGFLVYFVLTFFWFRKFFWIRFRKLLPMALGGYFCLNIIAFAIDGIPSYLIPGYLDECIRLLGILSGAFLVKGNRVCRVFIIILALLLLCNIPYLYDGYWRYLSYGTFSGRVDISLSGPLLLENETDTLVIGENAGKIYVLDCWNTRCGYCIREFPEFQKFFDKFKGDDRVEFYALNVHEKEIARHIYLLPSQHGCQVPVRVMRDSEMMKRYGVLGVPTYLVISPEGRIVYLGDGGGAERFLKGLLHENE